MSLSIQPNGGAASTKVIFSTGNDPISSSALNDNFSTLNPAKWTLTSVGNSTYNINNGLHIVCSSTTGGSSLTLESVDTYRYVNAELDYTILHASSNVNDTIFVGLQFIIDGTSKVQIFRTIYNCINSVYAESIQAYNLAGSNIVSTASSSGKFRLMICNGIAVCLHNDIPILTTSCTDTSGNIRLLSNVGSSVSDVHVVLNGYKQETGVIFDTEMSIQSSISESKLVCMTPDIGTKYGTIALKLFDYTGDIATGTFEYPIKTGLVLSNNDGIDAKITSDSVLR